VEIEVKLHEQDLNIQDAVRSVTLFLSDPAAAIVREIEKVNNADLKKDR
jgi:hypothetical protein